jgi:hypothetical protein
MTLNLLHTINRRCLREEVGFFFPTDILLPILTAHAYNSLQVEFMKFS